MATLFERLMKRSARDQKKTVETFGELVAAALDDEKKVDESSASAILEACKKTPQDLADAVALLAKSRKWSSVVEAAAGTQSRLAEIEQRFQEIADETVATRERLAGEERELGSERNALMAQIAGADQAAARLRESCDSVTKTRERELTAERLALITERRKLFRELSLPDHTVEADTSADLRALQQERLNLLRRQKTEDGTGRHKLLGDSQPLADALAEVNQKIAREECRIKPTWQNIAALDKQIETLGAASQRLSDAKLVVV